MKKLSLLSKRSIPRRAEEASRSADSQAELRGSGISLGQSQEFSGPEFLELLDDDTEPAGPSVTITVYLEDSPAADRYAFEDALSDHVESHIVGHWIGGGQGDLGAGAFFDVTFAVGDPTVAVPIIQEHLRFLGAGPGTTISTNDGQEYGL